MRYTALYIVLVLLATSNFSLAQQSTVDSLHQVLASELHDTTRVNALNKLAYVLSSTNHDSAMGAADEALVLSQRVGFRQGEGRTSNIIGIIHWQKGRYDKALESYHNSLHIGEETGDRGGISRALGNIGIIHSNQGRYDQALEYHQRSLRIYEDLNDEKGVASALTGIGVVHQNQGRYEQALVDYQKSLSIKEELGDKKGIASSFTNIGSIHARQGRHEQALEYFQSSLSIQEELGNQNGMALSLNNISIIEHRLGRYDKALENALRSLFLREELGDKYGMAVTLNNIGSIYRKQRKYKQALESSRKSLHLRKELDDKSGIAIVLNDIGTIYTETGIFDSAVTMYTAAYSVAEKIGAIERMKDATEGLSHAYGKQGDFRNAYKYHQEYATLKDSLLNEENLKSINEMEAKYEAEKREQQIVLLEKDKELQDVIRNSMIGGVVLLSFLAIGLYHRYRYKKRTGEELQRSYEQLQKTQQQLIHAEKMATLGELTAGVAHEIKNPLNFITNFSGSNAELYSELKEALPETNGDIAEIVALLEANTAKIHEHGSRADRIVNSMLMHSRETKGVRQQADINEIVVEAVELAQHGSTAGKDVDVTLNLGDAMGSVEVLPAEISRVVLNLVGNATYAAKKQAKETGIEPEIIVSTERTAESVQIVVTDNGPGIPPDVREKIFQPFFTTKPTGDGTGLGLSLSWDIVVNGHNGTIEVESEEGKGAKFIVELPVQA